MCEVDCPYKKKCTSHPSLCNSCRNNSGRRSYYIPDYKPRPYPYEWWQTTTISTTPTGTTWPPPIYSTDGEL